MTNTKKIQQCPHLYFSLDDTSSSTLPLRVMKVYAVHLIDSRCTEKNHMDIPNLEVFETAKVNSRVGSGYQAETAPQLKEAIILRPQQIYVSQHDHCQISPCLRFANQFQTNNLTVHFICVSLPALRSCHFCASEPYRSITRL